MAFNTVRSSPQSLGFDAFYSDEFGDVDSAANVAPGSPPARVGLHKNRHVLAMQINGRTVEVPKNSTDGNFQNPANPNFNIGLDPAFKQTQIPAPPFQDRHTFEMYFSDTVSKAVTKGDSVTIAISILFAVGTELNRHGVRSFFQTSPKNTAVILIPGTEPPRDPARWGIGITDAQIKTLIKNQFSKDVPYEVQVLASFSTGACGLHQSLLHNLIDVSKVSRLIYFDCLYQMQCDNTPADEALKRFKRRATNAKIIVYKTSEGGNQYVSGSGFSRLTVPDANPSLFDRRGFVENLFQNTDYISLVLCRSLESAATDRIVSIPSGWATEFTNVRSMVTPVSRGSFISNKAVYAWVHGISTSTPPASKTFFEDWAVTNHAALTAFSKQRGSVRKTDSIYNVVWGNHLPGWPGGDGEEKHDLLIPEFGWEFLVP